MKKPPKSAALAAAGSLVAMALLISACSSPSAAPTGSPFQSGTASTRTTSAASAAAPTRPISTGTVTATVTVTSSTLSGSAPRSSVTPVSTSDSDKAVNSTPAAPAPSTPTTTAPLDYDTTLPPPPVPIGAAGTQVTPTLTMETVTPTAMARAPYPAISTPTHIPRPADDTRTNPVQLAAAFVAVMEQTSATDSRADNSTLRAAPLATPALRGLLAAQSVAVQQPAVGTNRVTIRSAVITAAGGKSVTVAVLYDRITIISASENFNQQKLLLRLLRVQRGTDGKWLVAGYQLGAN